MSVLLKDQWVFAFGPFVLDPSRRVLTREGAALPLTKKAFDLLLYLVENPDRVVEKDELLGAVWPGRVVEESNLSQTVFTLRKTLGNSEGENVIATSQGRGYRIDVPVRMVPRDVVARVPSAPLNTLVAANSPESQLAASGSASKESSASASRRVGIYAPIGIFLIAIFAVGWVWRTRVDTAPPTTQSVVLADFDNATGNPEFDDVLGRILEIDLSQSPYLSVLPSKKIQETLQQIGRAKEEKLSGSVAQQVCERNQANAVIGGALAMLGSRYVITLIARNCVDGGAIVASKAEASSREAILQAIDDVTARIRTGIGETKSSVSKFGVPLAQATTPSFDALKAFSLGLQARAKGDDTAALTYYKRAIELDPNFAMAYIELGVIHRSRHEQEVGNAYLKQAYALRENVGAHEKMRIAALYELSVDDTLGMIQAYKSWTQLYPQDWQPWANLSNVYTDLGNYSDAIAAGKEAVGRKPDHGGTYFVLARAYTRASQFELAKQTCAKAVAKGLDGWDIRSLLFEIAFAEGDKAAMHSQMEKMSDDSDRALRLELEGFVYASMGKQRQARANFELALTLARTDDDSDSTVAQLLLDEIDAASKSGLQDDALQIAAQAQGVEQNEFAPIILAEAGDVERARTIADALAKRSPADLTAIAIDIPAMRAAIDLRENRPQQAIDDLQPALAYEWRNFEVPSLLARAYLDANMPQRAAEEYQKIIAHPGVDALSILLPLAHLGRARAESRLGDLATSRAEYARFFDMWSEADRDLPVLVSGKAEEAGIHESR